MRRPILLARTAGPASQRQEAYSTAPTPGLTDILSAYGVGSAVGTPTIDPLTPNTLYAVTAIGMFKSNDGGAIWSPTGLFQHSPLVSLSLNPTVVTAGTSLTGTVALITA